MSLQALEKEAEAGAALDQYEVEGPDRAEILTNLGEFQLAVVSHHLIFTGVCLENQSSSRDPMVSNIGVLRDVELNAKYIPVILDGGICQGVGLCQAGKSSLREPKFGYRDTSLVLQSMYNGIQENNCSEQASRMSAMENSTKNASEILEKLTLSYNRYNPTSRTSPTHATWRASNTIKTLHTHRQLGIASILRSFCRLIVLKTAALVLSFMQAVTWCTLWYRSRQAAITTELTEIISGAAALEE